MCTHNTCIQSAMEEYSSSMPAHKKHSTSQDGTADWATVLPKPWCWARLRAGGKGGDRGWDDRTTSPTQCPWAWGDSGRYWRTRNPGVLQSMGLKRVEHWATEQQQRYISLLYRSKGELNSNAVKITTPLSLTPFIVVIISEIPVKYNCFWFAIFLNRGSSRDFQLVLFIHHSSPHSTGQWTKCVGSVSW